VRSAAAERFDPPLRRLDWRAERRLPLADFLADARARLADAARFESALRHGGLHVNGRPLLLEASPAEVPAGSWIRLYAFEREPEPVAVDASAVLDEDGDRVVAAKPAWLTMQGSRASQRLSLEAALRALLGAPELVAVHRLDRQTSGVAVFAKHPAAARALARAFAAGGIAKRYLALVSPPPAEAAFEVRLPLARAPDPARHRFAPAPAGEPGHPSQSLFRVLGADAARALLLAEPRTGRTHQLRVHLAARGLPIVGDALYGPPFRPGAASAAERVQLHAWRVALPEAGGRAPRVYEAPLPPDFEGGALVPCAIRSGPPPAGVEPPWI
jgi:RluA family pseudouridine synthase